jgi:hypothetical protein
MESPGSAPKAVRIDPTASQGYVVALLVEYDAQTEREARSRALRDAEYLFQQPDVLAVTADAAHELFPLTKAYLADELA